MPGENETISVTHNAAAHRFEAAVDGLLAVCEYRLEGDRMIFTHTFVPPALRGKGIAERLVRAGLEMAQAEGRKVVPACSYVATFVARHPEFSFLVDG